MSCVKKTMDVTPGRGTSISIDAEATCQIRTDDPEITSHVLWPAELRWQFSARIGKLPPFVKARGAKSPNP